MTITKIRCIQCGKIIDGEPYAMGGIPEAPGFEAFCSKGCFVDNVDGVSPEEDHIPGEECGRWSNGRLGQQCSKAGSEECDFECPYSR